MPELPEVETVRRDLESQVCNKSIERVETLSGHVWKDSGPFAPESLEQDQFTGFGRKGKFLYAILKSGRYLMAHLKMTGQFLYQEHSSIKAGIYPLLQTAVPGGKKTSGHFRERQAEEGFDQHTHVLFHFIDGSTLAFRDVRKFGFLQIMDESQLKERLNRLGVDPLESDAEQGFVEAFQGRKKSLKAVLMDQSLIAGIGNIYADEICHDVGVRPQRSVRRLGQKKLKEIYQSSREILTRATALKGTTIRDYTRADGSQGGFAFELNAYGRNGADCHRCKGIIKKVTYLGRGTHYCPRCQS